MNDSIVVKHKLILIILILPALLIAATGFGKETAATATAGKVGALIAEGRRSLQGGDVDHALQSFEEALKLDASNAEAFYYAGTIYIHKNDVKKGLGYLERSVELAPKNVKLRFILAQTYEGVSLLDKAIAAYHQVEEMAPNSPEAKESARHAQILIGRQYGEKGNYKEALKVFSQVLAKYPNDVSALMNKGLALSFMGDYAEAEAALQKALAIQPDNIQLHTSLAEVFEKKGDLDQSKKYYQSALKLAPPGSPIAKRMARKVALIEGAQFLQQGDLANAQRIYEKVYKEDPQNPVARINLARIYHDRGDLQRAQAMLLSLEADDPNNLDVKLRLGASYFEQGDVENAVRELETIIAEGGDAPQVEQAAKLLENIRSSQKGKLAREMTADQRIAMYRAMLKGNPDDRQAWLGLGLLYIQLQRREEAKKAFENVIRLDGKDAQALAVLGGLYEDTDELDKAIETYKRAYDLEKDPEKKRKVDLQLRIVTAKKTYADGKLKEAEEQFKALLKEDGNNYTLHFYLALIYSRTDRMEQAISEYQKVLKIVPGHLGARLNLAVAYERVGRDEDAITEYQHVARSGVPNLSETAKTRLDALVKRVGGFSYTLGYSLNFDSNSNLSSTRPLEELRSDTVAAVTYRRKLRRKQIYWGISFTPTYSVYHQQQFDFLTLDASPFLRATWAGIDFSGNYAYSKTDSVLTQKNYNVTNRVYADALKRFKMVSLLPFITAKDQRKKVPSVWRVSGSYRHFRSPTSPAYDSNSYSIGVLLNQGSSSGWSWTGGYTYSNNKNLKSIGNDFAYSSHAVNLQLSKTISPKLSANGSYAFIYTAYTHPDSVTKFTKYRINKLNSISVGLNYVVNNTLRLNGNLMYQRNNSNLPTGYILSTEDASTLVGIQSPSLGGYHKYGITAGLVLNF
ncbi:MAG: tetratricopeptide repeat protein [Gammaproteobacteria bacterium]